jgi:NodT family efflux transporter outer membrane factor (OMF) lipoprotein
LYRASIANIAHRLTLWALLLWVVLFNGGCATSLRQWWQNGFKVGPNYARPAAPVAPSWVDAGDPRVRHEPAQDCVWWTVFNDPTLNSLIETSFRQNLTLQAAGTRILEARALRGITVGNLFPQSQTATSTYVHGQISQNLGLPFPSNLNVWADGFNASWEADVWGRYRRAIEQADANLEASVESYGDTLVMLLSDVATNYVQLRTFEQRLAYARQNVDIQRRSLLLAENRFDNGKATELDVRQARSSLAQTEASIPPLIIGRRQAANRLCILMGMPVTDLAESLEAAPIPTAPIDVAVGIPADLLRRRPDVRRAERQVAAQSAQIGIAQSDLYPRLALQGFIGYAATDFEKLFNSNSFIGLIIPSLQWNILNYGRIANNIRQQDARLQGAALQYQQTVLNAGREVEDALVGFMQSQEQAAKLEASVREADRSVELVVLQFQGGVTDFNRVFNAQSTLVAQQDQLAVARGNIDLNLIQVYRALGGGWQHFFRGHGLRPHGHMVVGDRAASELGEGIAPPAPAMPKVEQVAPPPAAQPADDR